MSTTSLFDATVPTEGTIAMAFEDMLRIKRSGILENVTGDITGLIATPSPITVTRDAYGLKGTTADNKAKQGRSIAFSAEGIRGENGQLVQPWLVALLKVAAAEGPANRVEAEDFDGKDPNLPAFTGLYSVGAVKATGGGTDKLVWNFTLASYGPVEQIASPIATDAKPVVESALPLNAPASANVYIRGYNVGAIAAATIGGTAAQSISQIPGEPNIVVLELPAGSAGSAPIIVTNAAGASTAFPYTRGA